MDGGLPHDGGHASQYRSMGGSPFTLVTAWPNTLYPESAARQGVPTAGEIIQPGSGMGSHAATGGAGHEGWDDNAGLLRIHL